MDELLAAVEVRTGRKISEVEQDWLRDLYCHVEKNIVESSSCSVSYLKLALTVVDQVFSITPGNMGYLEITVPPCQLINTSKIKEQDAIVLVSAAANFLNNRKGMETKVISIQGQVTGLTTILRVKEVVFFMFKLSSTTEKQHVPVIIKNSADKRNVYCSTAVTQFLPQFAGPQAVPSLLGTIIACVNSDIGIYQLDGKVRLHLGYQLHVNEGRGLRVGACVAVYNAHLVKEHIEVNISAPSSTKLYLKRYQTFEHDLDV
uniref:CST complex subunit CTC1 n=1 Tax=Branchiostoma floridae TaxID=7739 RepID=C3Y1W6_BRAFL|eukprot:XP_002609846.1 hypothetical protein BRAFLDRAFT_78691 [Branchiostoma floridae]